MTRTRSQHTFAASAAIAVAFPADAAAQGPSGVYPNLVQHHHNRGSAAMLARAYARGIHPHDRP
jgi:hypothetical protein